MSFNRLAPEDFVYTKDYFDALDGSVVRVPGNHPKGLGFEPWQTQKIH